MLNLQTIDDVFDTLVMCAKEEGEDHVFTYMDKWYVESFIYGLSLWIKPSRRRMCIRWLY